VDPPQPTYPHPHPQVWRTQTSGRGGPTGPVPGETADPRHRGQMAV